MDLKNAVYPFDPSQFKYSGPPASAKLPPNKHSQSPITTGSSVLALVYDSGVMMAADTLGSYGSLARYQSVPRLLRANQHALIGCSGDYADFQWLSDALEQRRIDDHCLDDGLVASAASLHSWLTRVLYYRRSRFDPLWTTLVVAGFENKDSTANSGSSDGGGGVFLGFVDKLGTAYRSQHVATGLGAHLVTPLLREATDDGNRLLDEAAARQLLQKAMTVCYYRDCRSSPRYQLATVTRSAGVTIEPVTTVNSDWSVAHFSRAHDA